jgi:transposase
MKTFRPYHPDQMLLLPPSLSDWLPDNHLARFVSDLVDTLDLSAIEDTYDEDRGFPPYHPCMMVKVLVYAYCTGTYSSRRIQAKLTDSVAFRFLAAGNQPDFRTISDFRKLHGEALAGLFVQVLKLCQQAGLVKLGRVAVDGTKIKANASKHKAMSYGRMVEKEAQLKREIRDLLKQAEAADAEEDRRHGSGKSGEELPAELSFREGRLKKIREAKAALEAEARAKAAAEGKDPKGSPPPADKSQRNFTDPESKIQKTHDGFIQGYNAQAGVDGHSQVIVSQHVTPISADVNQLLPAVKQMTRVLQRKPDSVLADAGYFSEANLRGLEKKKIQAFIAAGRHKHSEARVKAPRGRPPRGLTLADRVARKLQTVKARAVYKLRKEIVEPVFGQIKQARGFRQFLRRGQEHVSQEWALICTVHNVLKLHKVIAPTM